MATPAAAARRGEWRGEHLPLPGRGTTYIHDLSPRPGAVPLLLLHGWAATAVLNWASVMPALASRFRVIALDQRGHGRGIRIPLRERFSLADCADDAVAVLDQLGLARAVVVGYSMGGAVAQLVWRRHRQRVAGLVLCSTAASFGDGPVLVRELSAAAHLPAGMLLPIALPLLVRGGWFSALDEVRRHDPRALVDAGLELAAFRSQSWAGDIDVPTAMIVTLGDRLIGTQRQLTLARTIRGATVYRVRGDHFAAVRDPEIFGHTLSAACRDVVARGRR